MPKHCTLCASDSRIQDKVIELHREGRSYRDIETALSSFFKVVISASSIGRHLKNCSRQQASKQKENLSPLQDIMDAPRPEGAQMYRVLCHILFEGIALFYQRVKESGERTTPYSFHLEKFRGLDVLINMLEKLYPNIANIAEAKQKEEQYSTLKKLTPLQRQVLSRMLGISEPMTPEELKEFILQEIISKIDEDIRTSPQGTKKER